MKALYTVRALSNITFFGPYVTWLAESLAGLPRMIAGFAALYHTYTIPMTKRFEVSLATLPMIYPSCCGLMLV